MTPSETHDKGDGKVLMIVASGVVLAAVAIAVLAGISSKENAPTAKRGDRNPAASVTASVDRSAMPAVHTVVPTRPQPAVETGDFKLPGSTVDPVIAGPPPFEIDPEADFKSEAHAAWTAREFDKAAAYFSALAEQQPDGAYTHYMLGLSEWKSGRLEAAQQAMQRSAEINPGSIKTSINLSRIENDRGEFDAALSAARAALEQDDQSATARFLEARSLHNLGRTEEALQALESSLAIDRDNGYAQNLYGLMRIEVGEFEAAVEPLRAAAGLEPEVAFIQNNLGVALERSGDLPGALMAFRRAADLGDSTKAALSVARLEPRVGPVPEPEETITVADESPVPEETAESGI